MQDPHPTSGEGHVGRWGWRSDWNLRVRPRKTTLRDVQMSEKFRGANAELGGGDPGYHMG